MKLERCNDCKRLMPMHKLQKMDTLDGGFICKIRSRWKRECIEVCYIEDPPSEVSKEEAIKIFCQ